MDTTKITQDIERITEIFGMKASVCAKAMNITEQTFRSKKTDKNPRHCFNEKNLQDLIAYIKSEAEKL